MNRLITFKSRLKIFLTLFALLPLLLIGWNSYSKVVEERQNQRILDIENRMRGQGRMFEDYLTALEDELYSIVKTATFFDVFATKSSDSYFNHLTSLEIKGLQPYVYKSNSVPNKPEDKVILDHLFNRNFEPGYQTIWINDKNDEDQLFLMVVNQLTTRNGYIVAGVRISKSELVQTLFVSEHAQLNDVSIWNRDNLVYSSIDSNVLEAIKAESITNQLCRLNDDNDQWYMVLDYKDLEYQLILSSTMSKADRMFMAVQIKYIVTIGFLIILSVVMSSVYADHMYSPVRLIDKKAQSLIEGNLSTRLKLRHAGIFMPIVDELNEIAESSERHYNDLLSQSMSMIKKQDELLHVNQSLESNYEALKNTNRKLAFSKEKFEKLIKNINDLVWVIDEHDEITYVNDAVKEKLGRTPEEYIGSPFSTLVVIEDDHGDDLGLLEIFKAKDVVDHHIWFKKNNNDEAELMLTNTVRIYNNGIYMGIQGISRPVSESWLLTQKLTRRNQALDDIRDITRSLATENNLEALFGLIVQKINELYDVVICSVRMMNEEGCLELVNATGPGSGYIKETFISDQSDVRYKVIDENKMLYLEDVEPAHLQNYREVDSMSENIKSLVFLPLTNPENRTGVISVVFREKLPQNELMVLSTIGIQSTLAIKKAQLYEKQREEFLATIRVLVTAIEAKDSYTEGHSNRVSEFATLISIEMGMSSHEVEEIQFAGILHDIGKIGVHDSILTKKGRLSPYESDKIKEHPEIGTRILQPIGFSKSIMEGVTLHHKRYDLTGYPGQINVDKLPLTAGIIGVCDALDAMTSNRSYSAGVPLTTAISEIIEHKGTQFDPRVVDSILRIYKTNPEALESIISGKAQVMS